MNNPTAILHAAARAQAAQAATERATYLRALDDLAKKAEAQFWQARASGNYMETERWQEMRRWIADERRIAAREGEVQG